MIGDEHLAAIGEWVQRHVSPRWCLDVGIALVSLPMNQHDEQSLQDLFASRVEHRVPVDERSLRVGEPVSFSSRRGKISALDTIGRMRRVLTRLDERCIRRLY